MAGDELESPLHADQEYRAIEAALRETARGRWFLAEHSRRSRRLESAQLEDALGRLKTSLRNPPALLGRLHTELDSISQLLSDARASLISGASGGSLRTGPRGGPAEPDPPASLLQATEELHRLVWTLQGHEASRELCERINRQAAAIFSLSAQHAQAAEVTQHFAEMIDHIAHRIIAALETIELELGNRVEPPELGSYAMPDPTALDALLARPAMAR